MLSYTADGAGSNVASLFWSAVIDSAVVNIFNTDSASSLLMVMKKKLVVVAAISLIVFSLVAGILLARLEAVNLFTYPLSVGDKTYIVTVETNWNTEPAPAVTLLNSSDGIKLYFRGGNEKTISYNITIPTDLLWGNISLIRKYSLQDPDLYTLSSNSTHYSLQMTFDYSPFFSGSGYFVIKGTERAW